MHLFLADSEEDQRGDVVESRSTQWSLQKSLSGLPLSLDPKPMSEEKSSTKHQSDGE